MGACNSALYEDDNKFTVSDLPSNVTVVHKAKKDPIILDRNITSSRLFKKRVHSSWTYDSIDGLQSSRTHSTDENGSSPFNLTPASTGRKIINFDNNSKVTSADSILGDNTISRKNSN